MRPVSLYLQDDDPYVRKTAAMCVAKLHDINNELVEDQGFLDTLKVPSLWSKLTTVSSIREDLQR